MWTPPLDTWMCRFLAGHHAMASSTRSLFSPYWLRVPPAYARGMALRAQRRRHHVKETAVDKIRQALRGKAPSPESFFGKVENYGKSPEGADGVVVAVLDKNGLSTGEKRLVVLDPGAEIQLGEGKERPGIANYAKAGKMHTPPGGTLRIESAVQTGAVWKARWVSGAVHKPDQGSVFTGEARVSPLQASQTSGKPYRALDLLHLDGAKRVTSAKELTDAVRAAILEVGAGNAMVRFTTGAEVLGSLIGGKGETPEARAESALANERLQALTKAVADGEHGDGLVEVIPARRLFFGGDSAKSPKLDKLFVTTSEDGTKQTPKGFRSLLVTLQHHPDGAAFVTGVAFADGQGFKRYGHASELSNGAVASAGAAAPAPEAAAGDDFDDMPDVDLAAIVDASRGTSPGMG